MKTGMFDVLHAPDYDEHGISVERLKLLGRMAGLFDAHLVKTINACNIAFTDTVSYEDFVRVYTAAFNDFDHWRMGKTKPVDSPQSGCCVIL